MDAFQRFCARLSAAMLLLMFLSNGGLACLADSFDGKCIRILDGDTIEVLRGQRPTKVRLDGIDCPEKRQPFGQKARDFTASLVFEREVQVVWNKTDRYGRILGSVRLTDGRQLNEELVKCGFAWWYQKYSKSPRLSQLEMQARNKRLGLWNDGAAVPPWTFRKTFAASNHR